MKTLYYIQSRFVLKTHKLVTNDDCPKIKYSGFFTYQNKHFSKAFGVFPKCWERKRREILLPGKYLVDFSSLSSCPCQGLPLKGFNAGNLRVPLCQHCLVTICVFKLARPQVEKKKVSLSFVYVLLGSVFLLWLQFGVLLQCGVNPLKAVERLPVISRSFDFRSSHVFSLICFQHISLF